MVGGCTATTGLTAGSAKGLRIAVFQNQLLWKLTECVCISTFTSFNDYSLNDYKKIKKNALYLSVNVFSTKVLIGDTIFYVS